ncbi:hypothetical protein [Actinomadura sp. 3N508]
MSVSMKVRPLPVYRAADLLAVYPPGSSHAPSALRVPAPTGADR